MAIETIVQAFLFELGAIIIIATLLGIVAKKLKQPVILAYIIAGIIVGPVFLNLVSSVDTVYVFSHLGVACKDLADFKSQCELAREEGVLTDGPHDSGPPVGHWAFLRDPDGHTLELSFGQEVAMAVRDAN